MSAEERVRRVCARIAAAARRSGRAPEDVRLVAVSKTFGPAEILDVLAAGIRDFGENRAQELRQKMRDVQVEIAWHFVGRLQRNKARSLAGTVELIHSMDDITLAQEIARRAAALNRVQGILIEVNVARDPAKGGVEASSAIALALEVAALEGVSVKGLMTMPPHPERPEDSRPAYRELARLSADLRQRLPQATELSMGMTRDFEVAVEEGATIVRIGEAIFGPRSPRR